MYIGVQRSDGDAEIDLRAGALVPRLLGADEASARVGIIAGGALLLAGDSVEVRVRVGAGCALDLEDIGGTVAYGGPEVSSWKVTAHLEPGARLVWRCLPFIVADGSDVLRSTSISLERGAAAVLRETLVLGRSGEAGGRVRSRTDVEIEGRPLYRENLDLNGSVPRVGVLGEHRVMDSAMSFGRRMESHAPALQLAGEGTIVRAIGPAAHSATVEADWERWVASTSRDGEAEAPLGAPPDRALRV